MQNSIEAGDPGGFAAYSARTAHDILDPKRAPDLGAAAYGRIGLTLALFVSLFVFLAAVGLIRGANHDEGQYVAAVAMMREGLPFLHFDYLQTPLQPILLTPLAWLPPGYLLVALRVTNAALVAGAASIIVCALLREGVSRRAAMAAGAMLGLSELGLFAGIFARNDALPLLLYVGAICAFLAGLNGARPLAWFGMAGLLLGAAISAKISYAVPAAAFGIAALALDRQVRVQTVAALCAGGIVGLLPALCLWVAAPDAFHFGVFEYSLRAPQQWRILNGEAHMLMPQAKLLDMIRILATGAGLPLLLWAVIDRARGSSRPIWFLDMLIALGLLAAYLPDPTFKQYLIPVLPPLVIRLGLRWDAVSARAQKALILLSALGAAIGLVPSIRDAVTISKSSPHVLGSISNARFVQALVPEGPVASLSPELIAGNGVEIDRRFITGPFLFRTQDLVTKGSGKAMRGVQAKSIIASFDRHPPAAILIGGETRSSLLFPKGMDAVLLAWANSNGYRSHQLPSGHYRLLVRPNPTRARRS